MRCYTERCFDDAVAEVALAADSIRTGDTETGHSNTVRRRLTKPRQHGVAHAAAVDNVFLVERIVSIKRSVVDEEPVHGATSTAAVQLQTEYQTLEHH